MIAHAWTDSGKPIPYPSGQVSACVLCGEAGGATWDELVLCDQCESDMVVSLREPESPTRACCDCGETFTPLTDHAIRCRECAAVKYFG